MPPLLGRRFPARNITMCAGCALLLAVVARADVQQKEPAASAAPLATPSQQATPTPSPDDPRRIAAKVVRYAQRLVRTYDRNGNGRLEASEWQTMRGTPKQADLNRDGILSVEELIRHITEYGLQRRIRLLPPQPGDLVELPPLLTPTTAEPAATPGTSAPTAATAASPAAAEESQAASPKQQPRRTDTKFYVPQQRLPKGLPDWFLTRDRDGDGQLTISEFSPKSVPSELQQFKQLDRDGDGVVTAAECAGPTSSDKATEKPAEKKGK